MNPESTPEPDLFQQAWRTESAQTRVSVDADLLLKQVQRNQRDFRATILRRDVVEIGIALVLLLYWFYKGFTSSLDWTWYLTVPALLWVIGFFLVDRLRHPQTPSDPGEPLLECARNSLAQVEHQILLLRHVFWWYLLPFTISILTFFAHVAWESSANRWEAFAEATPLFLFLLGLYAFIDYVNQRAVRVDLEPRREELRVLLATLEGEGQVEEYPPQTGVHDAGTFGVIRRWLIVTLVSFSTYLVFLWTQQGYVSDFDGPPRSSGPRGDALASLLVEQREEKNLVGLAAMVMVDGEVEATAAYGERKIGSGVSLELGDRWHLGGIAKSVTATMIARLIEKGEMRWSDTVGEIFPEAKIHEAWKQVTLRQLLTDTAGAQAHFDPAVRRNRPPLGPESTQARQDVVLEIMAEAPTFLPGAGFVYSNVGYTIAGAMAEKVTGVTWEKLVQKEVFAPLQLEDSGFGPPKSGDDTLEEPRGHRLRQAGKIPVDDETDNTTIMSPSAILHMSLRDLCNFALDQQQGELGAGKLLSAETYKQLHTSELGYYACGWILKEPSYQIPHKVYWHNGSNTMWYALVVFVPQKNMVVAVTSNDGDSDQAEAAAWEIVNSEVNQFHVEVDTEARVVLPSEAFPKTSPFEAVRWRDSQPEVQLRGEWYELEGINDVPASEIVAFSRETYGDKWQKRFQEDLVELLARMRHPPSDKIRLAVQSLTTGVRSVMEQVPMTAENRQVIKEAAKVPGNESLEPDAATLEPSSSN